MDSARIVEDRDIDIEGLHRTIVESGIVSAEQSPDELIAEYDFETEFTEGDTLRTVLHRQRVVEDEVVDRQRLRADITDGDVLGMDVAHTAEVAETNLEERGESIGAERDASGASTATEDTAEPAPGRLDDDHIGMTVVDARGKEVGMVTDVGDDGDLMYVDAHPGIAEKIRAALNWGDVDEDDYSVGLEQISHVTDDEIVLKEQEELAQSE